MEELKICFDKEAGSFGEAFPIGNGELGAMVYGGLPKGRLSLNLDRLWSGTGRRKEKAIPREILDKARNLLLTRKFTEGETYIREHMLGEFTEAYQPLGWLTYELEDLGECRDYHRQLDLKKAKAESVGEWEDGRAELQAFASRPDQCILLWWRFFGKKRRLHLRAFSSLESWTETGADWLICRGYAPSHVFARFYQKKEPVVYEKERPGMCFVFQGKILQCDGEIRQVRGSEEELEIHGASEVILAITAETGYQGFERPLFDKNETEKMILERMRILEGRSAEEIFERHLKDYSRLFGRVSLSLPGDERMVLYYQFCRYLLLSCSREGTQAANLQGIWNEERTPPWNSNYTTNINLQMNYWGALGGGLSECFQPLLDLVEELAQAGQETAKKKFGCGGWCLFHNTDLWRNTEMTGGLPQFAFWPMGGVWLAVQIYDYYRYTEDLDILRSRIYPVMKGASRFCLDFLQEGEEGQLLSCPSTSPENGFFTEQGEKASVSWSSAMDVQLQRELFAKTGEAAALLGQDEEFQRELLEVSRRLFQPGIGEDGALKEWCLEFREAEPGHRHFSHLVGLFPGNILDPEKEEIRGACKRAVEKRLSAGGGGTGWSLVWLAALWARLGQGEEAFASLQRLLETSVFENFLDFHPPIPGVLEGKPIFQIDGNLGAIGAVNVMLAWGDEQVIHLLPALPKQWDKGFVKGLCLPAGISLDIFWEESRVRRVVVRGKKGPNMRILGVDQKIMIEFETGGKTGC